MILTRLGNKRRMHSELIDHFPDHKLRIELFFGAGGSYFYLPQPKYAILNDLDDDVTNLYLVIQNEYESFLKQIEIMPITEGLIKYWKQHQEEDPVKKAIRFIFLSNFTYLGKGDTLRLGLDNAKKNIVNNAYQTFKYLQNAKITNRDFRDVIPNISFTKGLNDKEKCFVYLDPVYYETTNIYKVPKWKLDDTIDCLNIMINCGIKSAMSEFYHPKVVKEAKQRGLNVILLKERANIKDRKVEILITNYDPQLKLF